MQLLSTGLQCDLFAFKLNSFLPFVTKNHNLNIDQNKAKNTIILEIFLPLINYKYLAICRLPLGLQIFTRANLIPLNILQ